MFSIYGIGNPLMDYIAYAEYDLVESMGVTPGTMNLINRQQREDLLEKISRYYMIPGGSCANTIRGVAWLSAADPVAPLIYAGAVGPDDVGDCYISQLQELGVHTHISVKKSTETGVSTIIVTPDCERTMFTYLGACREFGKEDLDLGLIDKAEYLHITGYMWDTESQKQATLTAISRAEAAGICISFDLADPFAVKRYRDDFLHWIPKKVHILFGNREEIALMLDWEESEDDEGLIRKTEYLAPLVIMKVGAKGCYVNEGGEITYSPGKVVNAVDTTGAGDFFASGFLFNMLKKRGIKASADLANAFGAAVVTVEGCSLDNLNQRDILASLSERH